MKAKTKKSKAELRVEIAKDVLKLLEAKKITAKSMVYIEVSDRDDYHKEGLSLKGILPKVKKCKVCALGSMFYGYVNRHNSYNLSATGSINAIQASEMRILLSDIFSRKQLQLIEGAFEQGDYSDFNDYAESTIERTIKFRKRNSDKVQVSDKKAMSLIMKNIIKNKGTFKP